MTFVNIYIILEISKSLYFFEFKDKGYNKKQLKMNGEIFMKNNKKELGYSSRKKKQLIEEAMSLCTG